jgi:hypothetical protein
MTRFLVNLSPTPFFSPKRYHHRRHADYQTCPASLKHIWYTSFFSFSPLGVLTATYFVLLSSKFSDSELIDAVRSFYE